MKDITIENNSDEVIAFRWPLTKLLEQVNPGDKIKLTTDSPNYYSEAIKDLENVTIIDDGDDPDEYPDYFQADNDITIKLKNFINPSVYADFARNFEPAINDLKAIYDYYELYKDDIDMPEDYEDDPSLTPEEKARIKEHKEEFQRLNEENTQKFIQVEDSAIEISSQGSNNDISLLLNLFAPMGVTYNSDFYIYIPDSLVDTINQGLQYLQYMIFNKEEYSTEGWYKLLVEEGQPVEDKDLLIVPIQKVTDLEFTIEKALFRGESSLNDERDLVRLSKNKLVPYCDSIVTDNNINRLRFVYRHLDNFVDTGLCAIEIFEEGKETFEDRIGYFNPYRLSESEVIYDFTLVPAKANTNIVSKLSYDDSELGEPIRVVSEITEINDDSQIIEVDFSA